MNRHVGCHVSVTIRLLNWKSRAPTVGMMRVINLWTPVVSFRGDLHLTVEVYSRTLDMYSRGHELASFFLKHCFKCHVYGVRRKHGQDWSLPSFLIRSQCHFVLNQVNINSLYALSSISISYSTFTPDWSCWYSVRCCGLTGVGC